MRLLPARSRWLLVLAFAAIVLGIPAIGGASITNTRVDPGGTVELGGSSWLGGEGVNVYSNGASSGNVFGNSYVNGIYAGYEWQCVELVNRLWLTQGWTNARWTGNGNQLYATATAFPWLMRQPQGSITYVEPGDVISLTDGGLGHAAVINKVTNNGDGSQTVEVVNQNTTRVFTYATLRNGTLSTPDNWSGYSVIGVVHTPQAHAATIALARNGDGRLELLAVGANGEAYDRWQTSPGGYWSAWSQFPGSIASVAAEANADGRLESFAVGLNGKVYDHWQTSPGGSWSPWTQFNGAIHSVALGRNKDGRLELFAVGLHGEVYHRWQTSPGGNWSGWSQLNGTVANIAAETNADGRIELFAIGTHGQVYHRWQITPGGAWSAWAQLDGTVHSLAVARNADGRLELFAVGLLGEVYHRWQLTPGGNWSGWSQFDGHVSQIAAETNADGRIELFAVGLRGEVYHRWQLTPGGSWSGWNQLDGTIHS